MTFAPTVPSALQDIGSSNIAGFSLPITFEISPLVLVVLLVLASIFLAITSVILIYHWRRFPFEHELFKNVERLYKTVLVMLGALAVMGILMTI